MRKRDIKVGMEVRHARGNVSMGVVTDIGNAVIYGTYPNGVKWIAHTSELQPWPPTHENHCFHWSEGHRCCGCGAYPSVTDEP